jgi:hydrogenase/urease accessory protein HupE
MSFGSRLVGASTAASASLISFQTAQAHIVASRLGDFYAGALHSASDLQDVLLWFAIGLLAGSLGAAKAKWLVLVFPLGLLTGAAMAQVVRLSPAQPLVESGLIVGLGLLLAANLRVPTAPFLAGIFAIAVLRGAANASGVAPETNLQLFAMGLALTGYAAVTFLAATTLAFRGVHDDPATNWRKIAIRALGSWLAAIGLMAGGLSLTS